MAKTLIEKVQDKAAAIRKRHPNKGNSAVMKEAWKQAKGGRISGTPRKKKKRRVGATRKTKPRYYAREVHEVKRIGAISYTGGKVKISGSPVEKTKQQLRHELAEEISWLEVAKSQGSNKTEKKRLQKMIAEKRTELNRIK